MKELLKTRYGSHLYGTNTPTSDEDWKVVYLAPFDQVLLGKKLSTFKNRFDAQGNKIGDGDKMPDGGVETEFVSFQTFCSDYLGGQTYALEMGQALGFRPDAPTWLKELVSQFTTANISSMAGFAMKQTFDYVHRGRRLEAARRVLNVLDLWEAELDTLENERPGEYTKKRLDTVLPDGSKVLHVVAAEAGLELGESTNQRSVMQTLKLNGREYLETTRLSELRVAVQKLVDSYGHRSAAAAEMEVDRKSLMHAVRVYEQAVELLTTGRMTFPRTNAAYLLSVKNGSVDTEDMKTRLLALEAQVTELQANSKMLREKTPELQTSFDFWLLQWLKRLYAAEMRDAAGA